ncbi:hypothetical protein EMIT0P265_180017 [Pseudomonas zeae]
MNCCLFPLFLSVLSIVGEFHTPVGIADTCDVRINHAEVDFGTLHHLGNEAFNERQMYALRTRRAPLLATCSSLPDSSCRFPALA